MSVSRNSSRSPPPNNSLHVPTSPQARAKRKIATLMEEVELLKQDKATKQRYDDLLGHSNCSNVLSS
jgi:hypothetical protein